MGWSADYYYCQQDGGLCKVGSVVWNVPVRIREGAETMPSNCPTASSDSATSEAESVS